MAYNNFLFAAKLLPCLFQNVEHLANFFLFLQKNKIMRTKETFRQYIWLVNCLHGSKRISLERLKQLWIEDDMDNGRPLSRTTFFRLKKAIDDMFGILVECDTRNGYQYFIANPENLEGNSTERWMLQTLTVSNFLADSISIKDRIVLESIPAGIEYLRIIIKAMKRKKALLMGYKKFGDDTERLYTIEPYCLKVFRQRWYLLGNRQSDTKGLRFYALDRVTDLRIADQTFDVPDDFCVADFMKYSFGVFIGNGQKPERVVLRTYGKMTSLLRTLPKHHSQKEIAVTDTYSDFEFFVVPTFDFVQEILKEGGDVEVREPSSLRNEMVKKLQDALARYSVAR